MRSIFIFPLMISLLLSFVPGAFAQKKSKVERKILGNELAFGRKAAEFGLWNEAIFRWKKVVDNDPDNSDALNNLAVAYESVGNYERAGDLYQAALDLDEDSQAIRKNLKRFRSFYRKHRKQLERDQKIKARKRANAAAAKDKKPPPAVIHQDKKDQRRRKHQRKGGEGSSEEEESDKGESSCDEQGRYPRMH